MLKITFIGAGSVTFTRELLGDLLAFEELADAHIALHDIDEERLRTAEAMARWIDGQLGGRATITTHLDRREALDGADFAINMIQVGMHESTLLDFDIPAKYGLRQTIGDTLGTGGIFRALRTIPVLLGIGEDMAAVCPDAWLLNYTNPMSILCQAYAEGSPHKKIVGLCHSIQHTTRQLAEIVDVPFEDVTFLGAGVNHQAFILRFERDGEDLYPRLAQRVADDPELQRRVRVELYRRLGYFPTESSEHSAEYLPWFLRDDELVDRFRLKVGDYIDRSQENLDEYEHIKRGLASGEQFEIERSLEYASLIIHAMHTGQPQVIYGTVQNTGLLPDLPARSAVEVPCVVDRTGVRPTPVPDYPAHLAALNRTFLNVADLTVRAALEGRRDHVLHAAMLDPATAGALSLDQTAAMVDELLAAHGDRLPEGLRG
ncbi:alpha-glucosidase/alpha-galactosidase [Patulibacter sp. SYSU D01012]|uniref:alpha-glucosidase/alpha-galactosidase n=1 Tax=Patulibacter sp. SYSU D01012 TaxID=2817381 RepID=UPI001B30F958|nr:alpha-glucosidase/alpha-galactosidase [Patulibacter sp. SYSU D01012]